LEIAGKRVVATGSFPKSSGCSLVSEQRLWFS
jgi:hypothetical protein